MHLLNFFWRMIDSIDYCLFFIVHSKRSIVGMKHPISHLVGYSLLSCTPNSLIALLNWISSPKTSMGQISVCTNDLRGINAHWR